MATNPNNRQTARPRLESLEARLNPASIQDYSRVLADPSSYASNRILITLAPTTQPNYRMGAYGAGIQLTRGYSLVPGLYEARLTGTTVSRALQTLEANNFVATASPNIKIEIARTPNDPGFSRLYGLNNTGQTGGRNDADIDAPEAWDRATGTGNTLVAVIDTGIDYRHPDLAANIWTNPGEIAGNGRDDDGNGYVDDIHGYNFVANNGNPMDDNGHGTHVSGTIAGVGDNGVGVAGVNWRGKLMALKFLDSTGSGYVSDAVAALDYAVRMGAKISNNSWGGGGFDPLLARAISNARTAGHIFVAAAGNESSNNDVTASYPANYAYDNVVSVAATDLNDNLAFFSNYGASSVDIAAPGVGIYSTVPNNSYATYSGTSMATPHVTGALSLLWDSEPNLTYRQVIDRLYAGADRLASLNNRVVGSRRLNVNNMISQTSVTPPPAIDAPPIVASVSFLAPGGALTGADVTFSEAIDPGTIDSGDFSMTGPNGTVPITGVTAVSGSAGKTFRVSFASAATGAYSLAIGPNIADLAGNLMDQNGNGTPGENSDAFIARATLSGSLSFENTTAQPIRDFRNTNSSIYIGANFNIADLNVSVNLDHTYVGDLVITLKSPSGKVATLFKRRGADGQNMAATMFDDEATTAIGNGQAPFTGAFQPESPLSIFDGGGSKGFWTLTVSDRAWWDNGTLNSWKMDFTATTSNAASSMTKNRSALKSVALADATLASFAGGALQGAYASSSVTSPGGIAARVTLEEGPPMATATPSNQNGQTRAGTPKRTARVQHWFDHALWARG